MPLETKRERADHVLHNAGDPAALEGDVARLLARIQRERNKP
jgi:dephospho-CoA kinase